MTSKHKVLRAIARMTPAETLVLYAYICDTHDAKNFPAALERHVNEVYEALYSKHKEEAVELIKARIKARHARKAQNI